VEENGLGDAEKFFKTQVGAEEIAFGACRVR
jgi:hypothetical protein